jgi:hypothetical protein
MGALQNRTTSPGQSVAQQAAQAQGADPTMLIRQMEMLNQVMGLLFIRSFQQFPNVANQISATMKQWSRAMKEAQEVGRVTDVVGKAEEQTETPPPITFGPAQMGQPPGAGAGGTVM